jgi:5-methylcytosine-specific restriction endonuclease McrA
VRSGQWIKINRDKERARLAKWRADNREKERARGVIYHAKNPGKSTARMAKWRAENIDRAREAIRYYRTRKRNAFVASVDFDEIYKRDKGLCRICGNPVDRMKATLDHIVPLARGGTHEPINVQIAHGKCNSSKGTKLMHQLTRQLNVKIPEADNATVKVLPVVAVISAGVLSSRQ